MKSALFVMSFLLGGASAFAQTGNSTAFAPYAQTMPGSNVSFNMVPIQAGSFMMGSPATETGHKPVEGPAKKVKLDAFWMGAKEVTYDEFLLFFNDENLPRESEVDAVTRPTPQYIDLSWGMGKQGGFPVNSMSQYTAMMYCRWLYKKTGIFYRLPTEAEWEYACRAGTTSAYFFGDDPKQLKDYAWFAENSNKKYQKTGQKKPNAWGLYDMLGNVSEWTLDQFREDYFTSLGDTGTNPMVAPTETYPRTVRGGGYSDKADALRCATRQPSDASWNKRDPQMPKSKWWLTDAMAVGFRIVRPVQAPTAEEAEAFYKKYCRE
ncbi:sulfatase-modifying factor [Niastella vici]|uniref:Sulfatase-modifying factor n=1 Tax=Niastella vici TaxID=1703345 RepID=A0A1V9FRC6_9BACT|nr:SUMF1/EgtB/PvdO family nonheme iron enzyme [Niastella vici]OQP60904.1 sulfatase-modifying factor [Niastella vici]